MGCYSAVFLRFPIRAQIRRTNSVNLSPKRSGNKHPSSTSCGPSSLVPANKLRNLLRKRTTRGTSWLFTTLRGTGSNLGSLGFFLIFFTFPSPSSPFFASWEFASFVFPPFGGFSLILITVGRFASPSFLFRFVGGLALSVPFTAPAGFFGRAFLVVPVVVVRSRVGVDGVEPGGGDNEDSVDGGGDRLDVSENEAIPSAAFPITEAGFPPSILTCGRRSVGATRKVCCASDLAVADQRAKETRDVICVCVSVCGDAKVK